MIGARKTASGTPAKDQRRQQHTGSLRRKMMAIQTKSSRRRIAAIAARSGRQMGSSPHPQGVERRERKIVKHLAGIIGSVPEKIIAAIAARGRTGLFVPFDIVWDILSRLPVALLVRLRCISKQWRGLTYNPRFVEEQYRRAFLAERHKLLSIELRPSYGISLHDLTRDGGIANRTFRIDFIGGDGKSFGNRNVTNPVNGLVGAFCQNQSNAHNYLLNPTTGELLQLPGCLRQYDRIYDVGLGHDESTGEYKLVRLYHQRDKNRSCAIEVLTVGTREWRYVDHAPCIFMPHPSPVFSNGALHWLAKTFTHPETVTVILAFDIKEEKWRIMSIPEIIPDASFISVLKLHQLEGHICLVKRPTGSVRRKTSKPQVAEIWMLKDYAKLEWVLNHKIDVTSWTNEGFSYWPEIIGIKHGKVFQQHKGAVYSHDLNSRTLVKVHCGVLRNCTEFMTESLISVANLI